MLKTIIKYKFNQALDIPKHIKFDHEDIFQNLENPDLEITTDIFGKSIIDSVASNITLKKTEESSIYQRTLDICITLEASNKALKILEDDGICDKNLDDFNFMSFARFYLGGWEGLFVEDDMIDFDSDLLESVLEKI
jgi:hypothetical protein